MVTSWRRSSTVITRVLGHADDIAETVVTDAVTGRALVFNANFTNGIQGVCLSALDVVEEPNFQIIHNLIFAGSVNRPSVNEDTDFDCVRPRELGHVLRDVLLRVLYPRQKHGPGARIVLSCIDVKDNFRMVLIYP